MEYLLLFHQPPPELEREPDDPAHADWWDAWRGYLGDLRHAGVLRGGNALAGGFAATTVRIRDGRRTVHDGPFADTKELLGGYVVIEVPSLDEALEWASRSPSSVSGSTEIRPVRPPVR